MKNLLILFIVIQIVVFCSGCAGSRTIIQEYDSSGKITKTTETNSSIVNELMQSTKNKTVIIWKSGWAAGLSVSTATTENPTPTAKIFVGKIDKGMISAQKDQKDWEGIAEIIKATRYDLKITTSGMKSSAANK